MQLIFIFAFVRVASSYMEFVPGEKVVDCSEPGLAAHMMDYSDVEIIMESDTEFFVNGTLKFLKPIRSPWKLNAIGERWERNAWVPGVEKKVEDACDHLRNPALPNYPFVKDQKPCPLAAGVSVAFEFFLLHFPSDLLFHGFDEF